ncbi:MAG: cation-transporting P-type ATPase [Candidatus Methanoperedens sp.]
MENPFDQENITGLSEAEVIKKFKEDGYNEISSQKKQGIFTIFINILKEPMLLLLIGAGIIYLLLGEENDAIMLLFLFLWL